MNEPEIGKKYKPHNSQGNQKPACKVHNEPGPDNGTAGNKYGRNQAQNR